VHCDDNLREHSLNANILGPIAAFDIVVAKITEEEGGQHPTEGFTMMPTSWHSSALAETRSVTTVRCIHHLFEELRNFKDSKISSIMESTSGIYKPRRKITRLKRKNKEKGSGLELRVLACGSSPTAA
jgi:hypothetical protein